MLVVIVLEGHDFVHQYSELLLMLENERHDYGVEGHQPYGLTAGLRVFLAKLKEIIDAIPIAFTRKSPAIRLQESVNLFLNQHIGGRNCATQGKQDVTVNLL